MENMAKHKRKYNHQWVDEDGMQEKARKMRNLEKQQSLN